MTQFVEKRLTNRKTYSHVQENSLAHFPTPSPGLHRTTELSEGVQTAQRTALHRHTGTANTCHVTMSHATIVIFEY